MQRYISQHTRTYNVYNLIWKGTDQVSNGVLILRKICQPVLTNLFKAVGHICYNRNFAIITAVLTNANWRV